MSGTSHSLLAFDFGLARIGVAVGQTVTGSAQPLETIVSHGNTPDWDRIDTLIDDWRPDLLLVGLPVAADGTDTEQCDLVRAFAGELARYELPVQLIDEHLTSREARSRLAGQRRDGHRRRRVARPDIDALSAVLIAEQWLCDRDIGRRQ